MNFEDDDDIVIPGEFLGLQSEYINGNNTYLLKGEIRSSILGQKIINKNNDKKTIISVYNLKPPSLYLPKIGDIVICKIQRVSFHMIYCYILSSHNIFTKNALKGFILKSDIHINEGELGDNFICFKQGDIIKAKVLSIGQYSSYKLSTVGSELGVIAAFNQKGEILRPVAWNLVLNINDMTFERRKASNDFSLLL
ncbi:exosome complex component CSL4, putative [Plasmodium reichenowi]|uniref:Exosome complex component CSL4, putative n=1 Tax=Plasmodium reichenowi TaxID=5854 RepID=A0A2P9DA17_PLARE|nr:exosome complex component CSL4, putative [Plasmodium reichenowi]